MRTALVLAGHGSHISPNTAGVVWALVDELRALGVADEVAAAFWKEAPSFHGVLDTLIASDVTIAPVFTARGYFTQGVIPAEMGLDGALTTRNGRTLRYTRALGEHPYLSQIVRRRVEQALDEFGLISGHTAVALIGHGTKRNADSRTATEAQADAIRASGLVAEVVAVYLEDAPSIPEVFQLTSAPHVIAVPYFLASGSHTTQDVPAELSLDTGQTMNQVQGRHVYYAPPVGDDAALVDLVLDLAREAGAPLYTPRAGSPWDGFPAGGREELIGEVLGAGSLQFGQLLLTPSEVRVQGDQHDTTALTEPSSLRAWVRQKPSFRPLASTRDLPGGWLVEIAEPGALHGVVETVYPGVVADWARHRRGHFRAAGLAAVTGRQTGAPGHLASLDRSRQSEVVARVCGNCVRHPTWFHKGSPTGVIPCAEPCNFWMSKARESG